MADVTAGIVVSNARVSKPDVVEWPDVDGRVCVYFPEPGVFLHGTPAELREFARQIVAKVGG